MSRNSLPVAVSPGTQLWLAASYRTAMLSPWDRRRAFARSRGYPVADSRGGRS